MQNIAPYTYHCRQRSAYCPVGLRSHRSRQTVRPRGNLSETCYNFHPHGTLKTDRQKAKRCNPHGCNPAVEVTFYKTVAALDTATYLAHAKDFQSPARRVRRPSSAARPRSPVSESSC